MNHVASDGVSENMTALETMTAHTSKDIFPLLNVKLPGNISVALYHPSRIRRLVFIGGKIPHWIKWAVNGLENRSESSHKRCLVLNNKLLGLGMIRWVLETVELWYFNTETDKAYDRLFCQKPTQ